MEAAEQVENPEKEPESSITLETLPETESIPTLADDAIQEEKRLEQELLAKDAKESAEQQNESPAVEKQEGGSDGDDPEDSDDNDSSDDEELDDNDDGPDFTALRKALDNYEAKSAEYDREISNPEPPFLKVRFRHQQAKIGGLKQVVDRAFASMIAGAQVIVESVDLPLLTECKCEHTLADHEKGAKCSQCACEKHEVNREKIVAYLRKMVGYEEPLAPEAIKVNTWH